MIALVVAAALVAAVFFILITVVRNTYVCSPNEVLIFSGRTFPLPGGEGKVVGFRVVRGGRAMRVPIIEVVDKMPLTNMPIELSVTNAFSKGGVPLNVVAVANIKIPSEEPLLHNALERFLGYTQEQIIFVARDTLEGNLRGVIAEMTPEEINQKKVVFQQKLIEEAHKDMQRLGLVLDNLQIQKIADDVGYLTSVGRVRGAEVRKAAKIGELRAQATAHVQKWSNSMNAEISKLDAETKVAEKENERRIIEAQTQRAALIAEAQGQVRAQVAEAVAQVKSWESRAEQLRRKLEADVVAPAVAQKQQLEQDAKGAAAKILAQGRASADALVSLAVSYKAAGGRARDALLLQKLVPIFDQLTSTMKDLKIDRLTVLGQGANAHGQANGAQMGLSVLTANEQIKAATGVDLVAAARGVVGSSKDKTL
jgi:flotillin